jgi:Glycosyl transferases group 1
VLYARSVPAGLHRRVADTVVSRLRLSRERVPRAVLSNPYISFWLEDYSSMSYMGDWLDAFRSSPRLDVEACNINDLLDLPSALRRIATFDLVVVLHSAAGDNLAPLRSAAAALQRRTGALIVFYGNEFDRMPDKIGFAREVGAQFIASQLPIDSARWLYAECDSATVLAAPAALNPARFAPSDGERPIDIGFRGALYGNPLALGDQERTELLRFFDAHAGALKLVSDIAFERVSAREWAAFLNRCRGTIGAESGTYYLERDDATRLAVLAFVSRHPNAAFEEVQRRYFAGHPRPVSGKAISSRHFEPIGTKTCQILLDGAYNGILLPDQHFIRLAHDYSNLEDAVRRFRDEGYRREMVERAHSYVLAEHTYAHRVDAVLDSALSR